jgi:hypothetical protein
MESEYRIHGPAKDRLVSNVPSSGNPLSGVARKRDVNMPPLAVALMIATAALMTSGALGKGGRLAPADTTPAPVPSPAPAKGEPSSERVLGLVLALEALRIAPAALDPAGRLRDDPASGFDLTRRRG